MINVFFLQSVGHYTIRIYTVVQYTCRYNGLLLFYFSSNSILIIIIVVPENRFKPKVILIHNSHFLYDWNYTYTL